MQLKAFLNKLSKVEFERSRTSPPVESAVLKCHEFTEKIDYHCNIKGRGCFQSSNSRCCCDGCRHSVGFLKDMSPEVVLKNLSTYAELFNSKTGYWRENEGCVLPRKLRSRTCLHYHCNFKDMKPEDKMYLSFLKDGNYAACLQYIYWADKK